MDRLTCLAVRDSMDELTYAVVAADQVGEIQDANSLRTAIKKAVTEWMQKTPCGKDVWKETSEDFNIGDLSLELDEVSLVDLLEKHGVKHLTIDTHSHIEGAVWVWFYDEHLFNAAAVEKFFDEEKKDEAR